MDLIYRYDPFQPVSQAKIDSPAEAVKALVTGNDRFADFVTRMHERTLGGEAKEPLIIPFSPVSLGLPLFEGATLRQAPFALVLGCSDARVPTEAVFDQSFNDLFVVRIAGNVLGTECLGSIDYAVKNMEESLQLVVVMGHSGCGAVSAAVDGYLSPHDFLDIACTHALRSLVDRIQIAVRGAAKSLVAVAGNAIVSKKAYREMLIEAAVYLNAAVTAHDLRREIRSLGNSKIRVVYGVYDLTTLRIRAQPGDAAVAAGLPAAFADAPECADDLVKIGQGLAELLVAQVEATTQTWSSGTQTWTG